MRADWDHLALGLGVEFFDYQIDCLDHARDMAARHENRLCLYYRTGAGKTLTSLAVLASWGHVEAVVVAPPSTHDTWVAAGKQAGIEVTAMSHARFRMKDTKLSRDVPLIADEMHMFGGHKGKGWKKLDRLAGGLKAPMILMSATPNYNDADRVYCVQHILDPLSVRGGFIQFLYDHCTTEQNPFGMEPIVTGFQKFDDAAEYLSSLPNVMYLPDDLVYDIEDLYLPEKIPAAMATYGYDERRHRMIGSIIEERHARVRYSLLDSAGWLEQDVYKYLWDIILHAPGPTLVYANHSTVAEAIQRSLNELGDPIANIVTGKTPAKLKETVINLFREGKSKVLVGTATLATGTDGLDKVCDTLVIVDDTDDDALRRQLIGRIMPRGADADASNKRVYRLVLS